MTGHPGGGGHVEAVVPAVRERLGVALDVGDLGAALELARRVAPWFGIAKIGHELYAEAGPAAFDALRAEGYRVFCDLKLHDIPTTVRRAARAHARHGVALMNAHAAGGEAMLRAFVDGAREGAADRGLEHGAVTLAVTVLTSEPDTHELDARLTIARRAGCDGVVCAAAEVARAHEVGLRAMVPGVRLPHGEAHDQVRVATPEAAARAGADWLVVGRAVTAADQPERAAATVAALAAGALDTPAV